jgi:tetratricopeptide (TPR) repeat protein
METKNILKKFEESITILAKENRSLWKREMCESEDIEKYGFNEFVGGKADANPGFKGTYEQFAGTNAGKLSAYNAGLLKFKEGKYQEAYDLLDKFSSDNKILMALKYGAMGDAQANLNKNEDALSLLDKAASASDDAYTSYYFTRKAGLLALAMKKNAEAKKYFETIEEKYADYDGGTSDAYIEMVKNF